MQHQQEIMELLDEEFKNYDITLLSQFTKDIDLFKLLIHKKYDEFNNILYLLYRKIEMETFCKKLELDKKVIFNINLDLIKSQKYQLKDIVKIQIGSTPSRNNPKYFGGEYLWCKYSDLNNNVISDTDEKITKEAIENTHTPCPK